MKLSILLFLVILASLFGSKLTAGFNKYLDEQQQVRFEKIDRALATMEE